MKVSERVREAFIHYSNCLHIHSCLLTCRWREFSHEENLLLDFQSVNVLPQDLMQNDDDEVGGGGRRRWGGK
jgi:hypothetical protein